MEIRLLSCKITPQPCIAKALTKATLCIILALPSNEHLFYVIYSIIPKSKNEFHAQKIPPVWLADACHWHP
jgi:hypothetical protein